MQVNANATSPAPAPTATQRNAMDYDAFLKLLIAEMKNQDPLSPTNASEYVAQFASFAQVEQALKTNQKLDELLSASALAQSGGLIGRQIVSGDGMISGEVASVRLTSEGPWAVLKDGSALLVGPGVTIS
ncbi:MAG: flagellar hook assembly protein FlgD [Salinarimonadaceae bacterium]|nr:MAG: flagellar hook assembly protein FlgD [Salinarimonadaceae bacterium]